MYKIFLTKGAVKYYKKCEPTTQRRLDKCFGNLKKDPVNSSNVKRLHGELTGFFRYRTSDLRVVYKVEDDQIVIIVAIGARGDIYKKM